MRLRKLGAEEIGEASSLRHFDPVTGQEEFNITDQDLAAMPPLEDEPEFRDILPDQIRTFRHLSEAPEEEDGSSVEDDLDDESLHARPAERFLPYSIDELNEG